MFKNSVIVTFMMLTITLFLVACDSKGEDMKPQDINNEPETPETTEQDNETAMADTEKKIKLPDDVLQKKDTGKAVKALQEALNEIGYALTADGNYQEETTWAVTDLQLQQDKLLATGVYNADTKKAIEKLLDSEKKIEPGTGLPQGESRTTEAGTTILANPYDQLGLVNKHHALPGDYIPEDLVIPDVRFPFTEDLPKKQLRKVAAKALEKMFAAGDDAGMDLFAQSGYRSFDRQDAIFASNVDQHGEEAANNFSARPGESEHQTGLTMDITSPDVGYQLIIEFGDTDEGKWVKEHAAEYGFIIRYPEGKEDITEYQYEPWHLRYVGVKAATEIMSNGLTLEEYSEE